MKTPRLRHVFAFTCLTAPLSLACVVTEESDIDDAAAGGKADQHCNEYVGKPVIKTCGDVDPNGNDVAGILVEQQCKEGSKLTDSFVYAPRSLNEPRTYSTPPNLNIVSFKGTSDRWSLHNVSSLGEKTVVITYHEPFARDDFGRVTGPKTTTEPVTEYLRSCGGLGLGTRACVNEGVLKRSSDHSRPSSLTINQYCTEDEKPTFVLQLSGVYKNDENKPHFVVTDHEFTLPNGKFSTGTGNPVEGEALKEYLFGPESQGITKKLVFKPTPTSFNQSGWTAFWRYGNNNEELNLTLQSVKFPQ